jgi:hypothetical protein
VAQRQVLRVGDAFNQATLTEIGPIYAMAQDVLSPCKPLYRIGLQMHRRGFNHPCLRIDFRRFNDFGLSPAITEKEIRVPVHTNGEASQTGLGAQAEDIIGTCWCWRWAGPNCPHVFVGWTNFKYAQEYSSLNPT